MTILYDTLDKMCIYCHRYVKPSVNFIWNVKINVCDCVICAVLRQMYCCCFDMSGRVPLTNTRLSNNLIMTPLYHLVNYKTSADVADFLCFILNVLPGVEKMLIWDHFHEKS